MITIDLNAKLRNLEGEEMKETLCRILASTIAQHTQQADPIKWLHWSIDLWNGKPLSVDTADFDKLEDFISSAPLPILARGQILEALKQCKTASEAKKN